MLRKCQIWKFFVHLYFPAPHFLLFLIFNKIHSFLPEGQFERNVGKPQILGKSQADSTAYSNGFLGQILWLIIRAQICKAVAGKSCPFP